MATLGVGPAYSPPPKEWRGGGVSPQCNTAAGSSVTNGDSGSLYPQSIALMDANSMEPLGAISDGGNGVCECVWVSVGEDWVGKRLVSLDIPKTSFFLPHPPLSLRYHCSMSSFAPPQLIPDLRRPKLHIPKVFIFSVMLFSSYTDLIRGGSLEPEHTKKNVQKADNDRRGDSELTSTPEGNKIG